MISNASILSHAVPTPARAVPVRKAAAARPHDGNSAVVIAVPDVDGPCAAAVDDGGSAVADGRRAAVADAVSAHG